MHWLFDKNSELVWWINWQFIYDISLNWVAYLSTQDNSVWNIEWKRIWVAYWDNIRDIYGKTIFFNPNTNIYNTLPIIKPIKPLKPIAQIKPLKPLEPLKPLQPIAPLWWRSSVSYNDRIK